MKKKISAGLLATLIILGGMLLPVGMAYAEDEPASGSALEISPSGTRLTLSPGDVLEGKADHCPKENDEGCAITVKNIGADPIKYRVYASPYAVKGENNELSFSEEASTTYTQLSRWITVQNADGEYREEAQYTVQPGETQTVRYKVVVPESIPGGSQYAVIWAQIMSEGEGGGIETVGQIGAVLTGRSTEDTRETAEIQEYDFTKFGFHGPLHASATVQNTGNVDFAIKYYYTAKTLFGKVLHSNEKGENMVAAYPDTTYHVNYDWEDTPFLGIFQVEWKIVAADQERTETAVVIIMPIIVMIVMILLLTVIIIWIIIISRKRKERKARKLV